MARLGFFFALALYWATCAQALALPARDFDLSVGGIINLLGLGLVEKVNVFVTVSFAAAIG